MQVTYENRPEDIGAILQGQSWAQWLSGPFEVARYFNFLVPTLLLYAVLQAWVLFWGVVYGVLLLGALLLALDLRARAKLRTTARVVPGPQTITLDEDFVEIRTQVGGARRVWQSLVRIDDHAEHLVLYISLKRAFVVPKRAFSSADEAARFVRLVYQRYEQSQGKTPPKLSWDSFAHAFQLAEQEPLHTIRWTVRPEVVARIMTLGADATGKLQVATLGGLVKQFLFLAVVAVGLIYYRYGVLGVAGGSDIFYFLMLVMTTMLLVTFGISLENRFVFLRHWKQQQASAGPAEALVYPLGLAAVKPDVLMLLHWDHIDDIADDHEAIVVYDLRPFIYLVLPKAAFDAPLQADRLQERMLELHAAAKRTDEDVFEAEVVDNPYQSPRVR